MLDPPRRPEARNDSGESLETASKPVPGLTLKSGGSDSSICSFMDDIQHLACVEEEVENIFAIVGRWSQTSVKRRREGQEGGDDQEWSWEEARPGIKIIGGGGREEGVEDLNWEADDEEEAALLNLWINREMVLASTLPGSTSSRPARRA